MEVDEALGNFVAGFVSGEGSFFVSTQRSPAHELGLSVTCGFSLKVRADDRELIETIWQALDFAGKVYEWPIGRPRDAGDERARRNAAVMLMIRKLSDLTGRVIPFFETYHLRGRQREVYELWKQVVQLMANGDHLTAAGLQTIQQVKARMNRP